MKGYKYWQNKKLKASNNYINWTTICSRELGCV